MTTPVGTREKAARLLGIAVGLAAMAVAYSALGWPAPAVSVGFGFAAYWLARGSRD